MRTTIKGVLTNYRGANLSSPAARNVIATDIEHALLKRKVGDVGFTCSAFDLLHAGHMLMLKDAKDQCDYLIVGLHSNPRINRVDKNEPIQSLEERRVILEGCKYVDSIVVYDTEEDLLSILKKIKPDVRILGSDWRREESFTGKELEIDIYWHEREHSYSTSELRKRVYDKEKQKWEK